MPLDRAGAASAVTSTSRQIGVSIGVALCGSVAGAALAGHRELCRIGAPAVAGVRGLGVVITVLGFVSTSPRAVDSAKRAGPAHRGPEGGSPMSDDLAGQVWRLMAAVVHENRDGWKRAVIEQSGLPFSRIRVLRRLAAAPMTVKGVADAAALDAPAATVAVNDLEERGLVVRQIDPSNRRSKTVSITHRRTRTGRPHRCRRGSRAGRRRRLDRGGTRCAAGASAKTALRHSPSRCALPRKREVPPARR